MSKFIYFSILFLFTIVIKADKKEKTTKFELEPVSTTCPFCKRNISTSVETSFDCCAFSLCCFSLVIPYIIVQNCRGKGFHVSRGTHKCPHCDNTLGTYVPL